MGYRELESAFSDEGRLPRIRPKEFNQTAKELGAGLARVSPGRSVDPSNDNAFLMANLIASQLGYRFVTEFIVNS